MKIDIKKYIIKTKKERQKHLRLDKPCIEIGGNSTQFKGLLAYSLNTTIPHGRKDKVLLCHACNNEKCSNPKHLYWGTVKENNDDRYEYEKLKGIYKTPYEYHVAKRGLEAVKAHQSTIGKYGKLGGRKKGVKLTVEHKANLSVAIKNWHNDKKMNKDI